MASMLAVLWVAVNASGADPEYYVRKGTWQESMQASREALTVHLSKPGPKKMTAAVPQYGPWFEIGPYKGGDAFKTAFPPEKEINLARGDGKLKWKRIEADDGVIHKLRLPNHSATYFYRTITAIAPASVMSYYGGDDGVVAWLNGEKILSNPRCGYRPSSNKAKLELRQGDNHLLVKVKNNGGGSGWYFSTSEKPGAKTDPRQLMRDGEGPGGDSVGEQDPRAGEDDAGRR